MGRLLDNRGENYVMYPLLLSFAAGMALLSQAESALVLLLSAAFVGLGYGSFMPTSVPMCWGRPYRILGMPDCIR